MKVGDKVQYVPDTCHALIADPVTGKLPFKLGVIARGKKGEEVKPLAEDDVAARLNAMRRSPHGQQDRKNLVIMEPVVTWPAVVTAVNEDGTVALRISHNHKGGDNCLECPSVKVDPTGKEPHTCRAEDTAVKDTKFIPADNPTEE